MKPSLISHHRLKISVTAEELLGSGAGRDNSRDIIGNIISAACRQTGFAAGDSRLMVETVPSRGGFTICVTRLPGRRSAAGRARKGVREVGTEPYIFVFDSLDAMLAAGSAIVRHQEVLLLNIAVIYCKGKWYISFSPVLAGLDGYRLDCLLGCISEFGCENRGGVMREMVLRENGHVVAEGSEAERLFSLMDQSARAAFAPSLSDATAADTSSAPNT